MPMAGQLQGTLTFLLTDLVASTRSWEESPAGMREAMERHDRIVSRCLKRHHGEDGGRAGDSVLAIFRRAGDAAACALALQRELASEPWQPPTRLATRIALHSGEVQRRQGRYYGQALNRCARLLATCHGGQVLISQATEQLLVDELPAGAALWDLGLHELKDLRRPEHVFQLVDLDSPQEFPPIRSMARALTNLPAQLTAFIGREDELKQLQEMHRQTRLLTLTGPGGAGKTRLALELASQLVGEAADGVWLVELDPLSDPTLVPQAVATGLGLKEQPGRRMADTLIEHARQRQLLLVLDNCEHLVEPTAQLAAELLKGCEHLSVLATSREPLKVPGELTWRVPPLSRDESLRLFADRARSHDPRFQLTDDNLDVVGRICKHLDFIPLAIELAAARVTFMPLDEILQHLEKRFALLTGGSRTAATRLRTLRAAMDWSYELLPQAERIVFRRLSVFAGRFSLEAVTAVCTDSGLNRDAVLEPMAELVDKSLVMADAGRYRLLETVRSYGRERLAEAHETDATQARLGAYVLGVAESRAPGELGPWLDRLEAIYDDIRNTLSWSVASDPELGIRIAVALTIFWQLRAHASEPRQFMRELLESAPADFALHATALYMAGYFAYLQLDFAAARQLLSSALTEARAASDWLVVARALEVIGLVSTATGALEGSQAALEEGLALARQLREPQLEAGILQQAGILASVRRDFPKARSLLEEAIAVRRTLGRADEASSSLTFLAAVALLQGDWQTARRCIAESLELGRALSDRRVAFAIDVLACLTAVEGNAEQALVLAGAAAALHESRGNTPPPVWDDFMASFLQRARDAIAPSAVQSASEAGRRMDYEGAVQLALSTVSAETISAG